LRQKGENKMVQVELTVGEEELEVLTELSLAKETTKKSRTKMQIFYVLLSVLCICLGLLFINLGYIVAGVILLVLIVFNIYMITRGIYLRQRRLLKKSAASKDISDSLYLKRRYTIDQEGVGISSELGEGHYRWNAFKRWGMMNHYIYLERVDEQIVLIDRDKLSRTEFNEIEQLLWNIK
jgi:hypothetical protein